MSNTTTCTDVSMAFHRGARGKTTVVTTVGAMPIHTDTITLAASAERNRYLTDLFTLDPRLEDSAAELSRRMMEVAAEQAAADAASQNSAEGAPAEAPSNPNIEWLAKLPPEAREAAERMLATPDMFSEIMADISTIGIAGEQDLAMTVFLIGVSRLLKNPLAGILQGSTSTGKTYLYEKISEMFPPHAVLKATQMTTNALFYAREGILKHTWVVCGERSRREDDDSADATRALREMLSTGKLSKFVPEKNDEGKIETRLIEHNGPIAYIESTTLATVFEEDANRCLLLQTDERPEQTRAVLRRQAAARNGCLADTSFIIKKHHAAQCMLAAGPVEVTIPFAHELADRFPAERVEARRAVGHVFSMVQAVALLRGAQRQTDEAGRIIATEADYHDARRLLAGPMSRLLGSSLSGAAYRFWTRLQTYNLGDEFSTTDASRREDATDRAVRGWLTELASAGFVKVVVPGRGPLPTTWAFASVNDRPTAAGGDVLPTL